MTWLVLLGVGAALAGLPVPGARAGRNLAGSPASSVGWRLVELQRSVRSVDPAIGPGFLAGAADASAPPAWPFRGGRPVALAALAALLAAVVAAVAGVP